jgi:site-specific recombinase XerD
MRAQPPEPVPARSTRGRGSLRLEHHDAQRQNRDAHGAIVAGSSRSLHAAGAPQAPGALLLPRQDGKKWRRADWWLHVTAAARRAGLPRGTCPYTLRHSFITSALTEGGMSTLDVARICGTSVVMIERHYGHLVTDAARERLARVAMR